jgi:hypothetical protein
VEGGLILLFSVSRTDDNVVVSLSIKPAPITNNLSFSLYKLNALLVAAPVTTNKEASAGILR